jgi:Domain of unknown function (DUF6089)
MKNGYVRVLTLAIFMFLTSILTPLSAQNWEVGATIGGSLYNGDIPVVINTAADQIAFGGGVFVRHRLNHLFAIRAQINAGQLFADEKRFGSSDWKKMRGYGFISPIYEIALLPEIRPFRLGNVEFFGFTGVALAAFNPTTRYNEPNPIIDATPDIQTRITADKNANFPRTTLAIPIGGGFQWFLNDRFAIGAEVGGRKTFTDYLDQISVAGSPKSKDYYFFGGLTLSFFFGDGNSFSNEWGRNGGKRGGGVRCPSFN